MTGFWQRIKERNATNVAGNEDINERTRWFNAGMDSKQLEIAVNIPVLESQKKGDHDSKVA
jgi:hypothetical protein